MVWMHTKPEVVRAIIDHVVAYEVDATRRFFQAVDGMLDIAYFVNDFGTQRGLFISPQMWRDFIRAPLKRYFDASHDFGCKVMKHSCGAVRDIIPFLIEDGVDILDPIQVAAAGMDLTGLVRISDTPFPSTAALTPSAPCRLDRWRTCGRRCGRTSSSPETAAATSCAAARNSSRTSRSTTSSPCTMRIKGASHQLLLATSLSAPRQRSNVGAGRKPTS